MERFAQSNGVTVFDPGGGSGLLPGFLLFAPIAGLLGKRAHFRTTLLESVFLIAGLLSSVALRDAPVCVF